MSPLRIFIGYDRRQPLAYNVLQYSILANASVPVAITPLSISTLPIARTGLTEFTYSRYLVPYLCNYAGQALFLDADMVVDADIAELFEYAESGCGVSVCQTKVAFERPSAMLFNNHRCPRLSIDTIENHTPQDLASWSENIGELPHEWNWCVGYDHDDIKPKLIHYTAGIPIWNETRNCRHAHVWNRYHREMNASVAYNDLMRDSVHHKRVVLTGEINR